MIAVIGVISAIAIPNIGRVNESAREASAKRNAQNIASIFASAQSAGLNFLEDSLADTVSRVAEGGLVSGGTFDGSFFGLPLSEEEQQRALPYLDLQGQNLVYAGAAESVPTEVMSDGATSITLPGLIPGDLAGPVGVAASTLDPPIIPFSGGDSPTFALADPSIDPDISVDVPDYEVIDPPTYEVVGPTIDPVLSSVSLHPGSPPVSSGINAPSVADSPNWEPEPVFAEWYTGPVPSVTSVPDAISPINTVPVQHSGDVGTVTFETASTPVAIEGSAAPINPNPVQSAGGFATGTADTVFSTASPSHELIEPAREVSGNDSGLIRQSLEATTDNVGRATEDIFSAIKITTAPKPVDLELSDLVEVPVVEQEKEKLSIEQILEYFDNLLLN